MQFVLEKKAGRISKYGILYLSNSLQYVMPCVPEVKYTYCEKNDKFNPCGVYNFVAFELLKGIFALVFPEAAISTIQLPSLYQSLFFTLLQRTFLFIY